MELVTSFRTRNLKEQNWLFSPDMITKRDNFIDMFRSVHRMMGENYWERFSIKTTSDVDKWLYIV